jgi:lysophospholipase L1-like esterase
MSTPSPRPLTEDIRVLSPNHPQLHVDAAHYANRAVLLDDGWPSRLEFAGHSYLNNLFTLSQGYRIDNQVRGMLGVTAANSVNRAQFGARVTNDSAGQSGYGRFLQEVPQSARSATAGGAYPGRGGATVILIGINDLGQLVPSGDGGTVMAQVRTAITHALRTIISRARASSVYEAGGGEQSGQWSFGAGFSSQTSVTGNSGTAYRRATSTTSATATFTLPSDFPGGTVAIGLRGSVGALGGTITWSGTASQGTSGTTSVSNLMPSATAGGNRGHIVRRVTGLTSGDASKTIVATVTSVDSTGEVGIDYAQIEATANPPLVVLCNVPRLKSNSAYSGYGNYWGGTGTPGSTGDADVAALNAAYASLVGEFSDGSVVLADIDGALGKTSAWYQSDGVHPNELGSSAIARAIVTAIRTSYIGPAGLATEYVGRSGLTISRQSQQIYTSPQFGDSNSSITLDTTGRIYAIPFRSTGGPWHRNEDRFQNAIFEVTTAGTASSVRMGIYDDLNGTDYPHGLVEEIASGPFATTSGGLQFKTTSRVLDPGAYWLVLQVEAAGSGHAAVRAISGPTLGGQLFTVFGALAPFAGWQADLGSGGALPAVFPSGASGVGSAPLVALQAVA